MRLLFSLCFCILICLIEVIDFLVGMFMDRIRTSRPAAKLTGFFGLFGNARLAENVLKYTYCFRTANGVINICCALNIFAGNQNPFSGPYPCEQRLRQINVWSMPAQEDTSSRRSPQSFCLSGKADRRLRLLRICLTSHNLHTLL